MILPCYFRIRLCVCASLCPFVLLYVCVYMHMCTWNASACMRALTHCMLRDEHVLRRRRRLKETCSRHLNTVISEWNDRKYCRRTSSSQARNNILSITTTGQSEAKPIPTITPTAEHLHVYSLGLQCMLHTMCTRLWWSLTLQGCSHCRNRNRNCNLNLIDF